ncbi:Nitrogen regulatory protein areA [Diplodia seriata]|uniref:Nitrogen regulatory protein areA n=1 Tax=Diplodia seriata TaxID=420778 RepID=A0A1S8BDB3_9PEZI|nr:Nitrogen regulatory protein areA [Diplodia seriata]
MATTTHYGQASYLHGNEGFHTAGSPSNIPSLTPASTRGSSYDTSSPPYLHTRNDVLEGTVFPEFRKNEDSDVNKLQEEDPMGIDMWKFYRNQSNVPDAERMENMTWRMMAINLRKAQQKKECALSHAVYSPFRKLTGSQFVSCSGGTRQGSRCGELVKATVHGQSEQTEPNDSWRQNGHHQVRRPRRLPIQLHFQPLADT